MRSPPADSLVSPCPAPARLAARLGRWRDVAVAALLPAAAVFNYAALRHYVFEDAYITFRYAANLAAGDGFVFQAGERVLGTSTPLFALLLGLLGALGLDIPAAGGAVFALALSACGGLGWRLLARRGAPNAGALFALAAVSGASGVLAFFGMELSLHLALIFLAAYLAGEEKPVFTGVVLGLVCLNRYDGVMAVAAVLLTLWLRRRRLPIKEALISGAIFGAWLLFAQLYFGSPLPNTYAAKAADVGFARYATGALEVQGRTLLRPLYRMEPPLRLWPSLWQQVVLALALPLLWRTGAALAALLRRLRLRRHPRGSANDNEERAAAPAAAGLDLAPLAFCAVFLWLGYSWIGPPLEHQWYLIPASYCLLALSFAAWARLLRRVPAAFAAAGALLATIATLFVLPWAVGREAALMTSVTFGSDRIEAYEDMARFARHHGIAKTSVLTYEPGYLTYLSGQRAIDVAGLVTPNIYYHGPSGRRSNLYELLEKHRPELAVLGSPVMHEPGIRERRYQLALLAAPGRHLWIRRDFFLQHLDRLYDAWQRGDYYPGRPARLRHPFAVDFDEPELPFWRRNAEIAGVEGLSFEGSPAAGEKMLTSRGPFGSSAAWSFPFAIDFDQLEFLFSANHDFLTAAQIYVDGLLAYEVVGRQQPGGPAAPGPLEKIEVPLYAWRGHTGMLAFVSAEGDKGFVAADRVASQVYPRSRALDLFESGAGSSGAGSSGGYDPAIWEKGFGSGPIDNKKIAAVAGLPAVQGRHAAASLFIPGQQLMESKPFLIDHRRLSFTVFDFGDGRTKIELRVDGQRKHLYAGHESRRVDLVSWDLSALQGRQAVLILRDEDDAPERGIGIDSILLHD